MTFYLSYGYHTALTFLLILSIIFAGVYFLKRYKGQNQIPFTGKDFILATVLTMFACGFYFSVDITHPRQTEIDEIDAQVKSLIFSRPGFDIFKPTEFHNFPAPVYTIAGHTANFLFNSIDTFNLRFIHIVITLISIFISYFLFQRIFFDRFHASVTTLLLAGSHILFAESHIGHLINLAVLVEVLSLLFLFISQQQRSMLFAFTGGVVAALGWIVYHPAKAVIIIWLLSLVVIYIGSRCKLFTVEKLPHITIATLIGFGMAVTPFIVGNLILRNTTESMYYNKIENEVLFFSRAREHQKWIIGAETQLEGYTRNIINGLTAFNKRGTHADGEEFFLTHYNIPKNIYFIDPLTGVFLWIGVLSVLLLNFHKRMRQRVELVIILTCFIALLFTFSFLITTAPNWPRLLITLPFVVVLTVFGVHSVTQYLLNFLPYKIYHDILGKICVGGVATVIVCINIHYASKYITNASYENSPIAETTYYIHTQSKQGPKNIYVYNERTGQHRQKLWNTQDWQRLWFNLFTVTDQSFELKELTIPEYIERKDGENGFYRWFRRDREPAVRNTVRHIISRATAAPHYFYLIHTNTDTPPEEFQKVQDWRIWLNLFTIFRQSFKMIDADQLFVGEYKLPATLFITERLWKDLAKEISTEGKIFSVNYLSSKQNLLIIEVWSDESGG